MQDAFYKNVKEDTWRFIEDNTNRAVIEPRAVDPKASIDNPPPLYPEALAKSRERLTKEEQLLFVKTYNNYHFNLKRNRLVKYIN